MKVKMIYNLQQRFHFIWVEDGPDYVATEYTKRWCLAQAIEKKDTHELWESKYSRLNFKYQARLVFSQEDFNRCQINHRFIRVPKDLLESKFKLFERTYNNTEIVSASTHILPFNSQAIVMRQLQPNRITISSLLNPPVEPTENLTDSSMVSHYDCELSLSSTISSDERPLTGQRRP